MLTRIVIVIAGLSLLQLGVATGVVVDDNLRPSPVQPVVSQYGFGVSLPDGGLNQAELDAWCRLVGARPAVVEWFQGWNEPILYAQQAAVVRRSGVTPLITWQPVTRTGHSVSLRSVARGKYDAYLRRSAHLVAALRRPVFIRFAHEMNLPSSPYGPGSGNRPADFVAAWRHVVRVFRRNGAGAAQFVWSPNIDCGGSCPFTAYFPGNAWIDWAGLDGYNTGGVDGWRSLHQVFASSYRTLSRLTSRPLMIAETASTDSGGDKAAWIRDGLLDAVPRDFPRFRLVIWFDRLKEHDWRLDSSASALAAIRQVLRSGLVADSPATAAGCSTGRPG